MPKVKKVVKKVTKSTKKPVKLAEKKVATPKAVGLTVPTFSLTGRSTGTLNLPKEIFGAKVNKSLLSQAIRVYTTNQKIFLGKTKTRGEIKASKAKIYRQKGTGRARHGAISAPIFVGGGIAFGPTFRKVRLNLPPKMKKVALISALSAKAAANNIVGVSGIEKANGKTKEIARLMSSVILPFGGPQTSDKKQISALIVTGEKMDNVVRGSRNIPNARVLPVNLLNAYEVLKHQMLLITKEAVDSLSGKGKTKGVK